MWLLQVHHEPWPSSVAHFIDYIQDLCESECPRTVPDSTLSALSFIEQAGEVEENSRIATQPMVNQIVNSVTAERSTSAPPTKKAPGFFINMIIDGLLKPDYWLPRLQARNLPTQEMMDEACRMTNVCIRAGSLTLTAPHSCHRCCTRALV